MADRAPRQAPWFRTYLWGPQKHDPAHAFGSADFRRHFRDVLVGDRQGRRYAIAMFSLITIIVVALTLALPGFERSFAFLLPIYFIAFNAAEYLLHRFPMHHRMKGMELVFEHVTVHHNFYADDHYYYESPRDFYAVVLPFHVFLSLSVAIWSGACIAYVVAGAGHALFFAWVGYSYYLLYELLHFCYHTNEHSLVRTLPFIDRLSRAHRLHHRTSLMTRYNFNITFPIFDRLCKTSYRAGETGST